MVNAQVSKKVYRRFLCVLHRRDEDIDIQCPIAFSFQSFLPYKVATLSVELQWSSAKGKALELCFYVASSRRSLIPSARILITICDSISEKYTLKRRIRYVWGVLQGMPNDDFISRVLLCVGKCWTGSYIKAWIYQTWNTFEIDWIYLIISSNGNEVIASIVKFIRNISL